jgi:putative ABC transport system permease protein
VSSILLRSGVRFLARHPWHTALSVLGIAVGVAVVFSIDIVNDSARAAFRLSSEAVTGRATDHVVGPPGGFPDSVYTRLRVQDGVQPAAPVVEAFVTVADVPGRAYRLLGIDPFAEAPFRGYADLRNTPDLAAFLLTPGGLWAPASLGTALGAARGDTLTLRTGARRRAAVILGFFDDTSRNRRGLANLLLTDVASAQEVLGRNGRLDRIDLILPLSDGRGRADVESLLGSGTELVRSQSRSRRIEEMSLAFSQNLFALSLLALVVGMFLIYNTVTFSVVQRRPLIGDLRALGVTRAQVFAMVLAEAAVVGATGTALGLAAGVALAHGLLGMVTRTINDLYFVLAVTDVAVSPVTIARAVVLGIGATTLSAIFPAREATATPPRSAQSRSALESGMRDRLPRLSAAGAVLLAAGAIALWVPTRSLAVSFGALLVVIAGFALLTPGFITMTLGRVPTGLQRQLGMTGRMALRGVPAHLSRSAVAIAALAIAVGTTIGVTTMVSSFRTTVVQWLEQTLDADVYVSPPMLVSRRNDAVLDPALVQSIRGLDGVRAINSVRSFLADTGRGVASLVAVDVAPGSETRFRILDGDSNPWPRFRAGNVALVSEPYANRHRVAPGDSVAVLTASGRHRFVVASVYQDYASDVGTVMIDLGLYRRYWRDDGVSGLGLFLDDPDSIPAVIARIESMAGPDAVSARSNRDLREASIEVFDRTFAITNVLRLITVLVAFIGVLSALMALALDRSRELGVLRAIGLTPGQLWRLVTLQTGVMGLTAGVIALPFGVMLATILIFVINKRSFGWTLDMTLGAGVLLQGLLVAVFAALVAGLYPAYRMSRTPPARALREE